MKIRILENTIRLRLTKSEVEELENEGFVKKVTEFPNGQYLKYSMQLNEGVSEPTGVFDQGHIKIMVPESDTLDWINSEQVGMENQAYTDQSEGLRILIEKDFQCLNERRHEDETDAFPNPMAN